MVTIRRFESVDWPHVWSILEPVFRAGETYAFSPDISEAEAHNVWVDRPKTTYVAVDGEDTLLGTYYIKPNQPQLGAHVCNCGYVVGAAARGQGIATLMCAHSQQAAKQLGFRAMQFNLVVATNKAAIHLWQKLGFSTIGTLPGAFNHPQQGFTNALVMFKELTDH
ncbi:MAG: GNAT family N-acetyltransferase [Phormidesmis sp.]